MPEIQQEETEQTVPTYTEFVERAARAIRIRRYEFFRDMFAVSGPIPAWEDQRPNGIKLLHEEAKAALETLITPSDDLIRQLAYEHDLLDTEMRALWRSLFATIVEG